MKYAIVYSSRSGNTKLLAETLRQTLQETLTEADCIYMGVPEKKALAAERLYIGFWTDKGGCDSMLAEFLQKVRGKEVFLFGTAGFGGEKSYFEKILNNVSKNLDDSNRMIGTYMCQGKMPMAVRERYERMKQAPDHAPNLDEMIENFDRALSHPDRSDLENLRKSVR